MKTDNFFHDFFSAYPSSFFVLIGEDEQKAEGYKFEAIEVKAQAFRFDGVFYPEKEDDDIYYLEVQFRKDDDLYSGLMAEVFLHLRQDKSRRNWRAVVMFPDESFDPGSDPRCREFFESGRIQRIYLPDLPPEYFERLPLSLLQIILDAEPAILTNVQKITEQLPKQIPDAKTRDKIIGLLINLLMSKFPKLSRKEIMKMVEPFITDVRKSRAYKEFREEILEEITPKIEKESSLKEKREIAKALLKKHLMSVEFIAEVTGLSQEEVLALNQEMNGKKNGKKKR